MNSPYDSILLLSFGGPEGPDDVEPFIDNVLRGRNVPEERKQEVISHYLSLGGISPLNAQNRAIIDGMRSELKQRNIELPIYFGNRNWHPFLADTLQQIYHDGHRKVLTFVTSAFSSYSGCRQYLENIQDALESTGLTDLKVDKIRAFYDHPGFVSACQTQINSHMTENARSHLICTAHSIPDSMSRSCDYFQQLNRTMDWLGYANTHLAFQSRSGPPHIPWLEPDVKDLVSQLHEQGVTDVVVFPLGFISDHVEVIYDLDVELQDHCDTLGVSMKRAECISASPAALALYTDLIEERLHPTTMSPKSLAPEGSRPDTCPDGCCPLSRPSSR